MRVFLSYSRRDSAIADRMVADLEGRGFEVVIDRRDLPYGEEWQKELADFIRTSDTVIWLASPDSVASRWCNWELGEVQRINKRLVPVRVAALMPEELPEALGRIHVLPVEGVYDPPGHLDDLVRALETDREWIRTHTRLADRAAEWVSRNRSADRLLRGRALLDAETWRDRRAVSAPPPGNDTLDLLLQSRRAAGIRQRVAFALGALLVVVGLAAYSVYLANEANNQRELAEATQREAEETMLRARDAELHSARISTNLAPNLLANGQVDPALLLLLSARATYGADKAPDALEIAFHQVLESVYRRQVFDIPAHTSSFDAASGIYIFDTDSHDLWRFDGGGEPLRILVGKPEDKPVLDLGDGPEGLLIVRDDLTVDLLRPGAVVVETAGALPPPSQSETEFEVSEVAFHPDGVVSLWSNANWTIRLLDTAGGATLTSAYGKYGFQFYYAPEPGRRYLVAISGMDDDSSYDVWRLDTDGDRLTPTAVPADRELAMRGFFNDCVRRSLGPPASYLPQAIEDMFYVDTEPVCWAIEGGYLLVSSFSYTSAGMDRSEMLFRPDGTTIDLSDSPPFATKSDQFTWLGIDPVEGTAAGIVNRDLAIATPDVETFYADYTSREPEAPATARLLSGHRIALVEPRSRRLVVYDYGADVRPSSVDPSQTAIVTGALFTPLNAGSCVGRAINEAIDRSVTGPGGIAMTITGGTPTNAGGPPAITLADGRTIGFGVERECLQLSPDRTQVVVNDQSSMAIYDLPALIAGRTLEQARLDAPPVGAVASAFPLANGDLIIADYSEEIRRWHRGNDGIWSASVIFTGDKPVMFAEPNADGTRLIIMEWLGDSYISGQLYSVSARSTWRGLGSDYKWFGAAFGINGEIVTGQSFRPTNVWRLPPIDELAEEARTYLPKSCAPAAESPYRSSACWPDWL